MSKSFAQKAKRSKLLLCLLGAFFLVFYALHVPFPSEKEPIRFYSTHTRDDLRLITLEALKKAKQSIYVHTYALTDPYVLSLLVQKARQGLEVHITYHEKNTPRLKTFSSLQLHPKKGKGLMHSKWIVIDAALVLIGTANLTTSSLCMHENVIMGVYDDDFARALIASRPFQKTIEHQLLTFFPLPHPEGLPHLLTHLKNAKQKVDIALFTFTHPKISEVLTELQKQGRSLFIALDQSSSQGASRKTVEFLEKAGLSLCISQGLPLLHHKWALIDHTTLLLGSANWTRAAFEKNEDYLLSLTPLKSKQKRFFKRMLTKIKLCGRKKA